MIELLQKLISFDTTQRENVAMEYIEQYIRSLHGNKVIYEKQEIGDNGRYNLIIKNTDHPDIILAWHLDVVPEFSKEQFIPKISGNRLYGRGAIDMKSWVAINLSLIDFMLKHHIKFFVLCYADEESNFLWMKKFVEAYAGKIHPKLTIMTEPTDLKIIGWFRGMASLQLTIKWKSVHSAMKHLGVNAISEYVYFVDYLEKYLQSKDKEGYQSLTNIAELHWGLQKEWLIVWKANMVPDFAQGKFSLRLGHAFSPEWLRAFTQAYFIGQWVEIIDMKIHAMYPPLIQTILKTKYSKYGTVEEGLTFWFSDIQLIKDGIGCDCLLIWPGPIKKAHQADEYVDIDTLSKAKEIIERILKQF